EKGRNTTPLRPSGGEREGPAPEAWEGEVGLGERPGIPHLTPPAPPPRAEREVELTTRALASLDACSFRNSTDRTLSVWGCYPPGTNGEWRERWHRLMSIWRAPSGFQA